MPAIGLLSAELTNNSAGTCIIAGRDTGLNTSGLVAGASVYVSTGGALTSTKPIGSALIQNIGTAAKIDASDGEIIIQGAGRTNDLPNLTNNYVWVGDSDGVPQPTAVAVLDVLSAFSATSASYAITSSHVTDSNIAYINKNNTFTGTQSFDNISVSGTGSFAYIQSITGSAKTIGDAFIILNNNTPTQVYAGVKVQDSGSTATTASIQWDGTNDQWFFEKEVGAAGEFGVVMGGPEYSDIASPAYLTNNRIAKGNGSHHLNDSNISDNGSVVDINSNTLITGSLTQSGSGLSFFTDGGAGGQIRTIRYSDTTNAGGTTYTDNYFGIIDFPPGIYDNALTMFKGTAAFGQYSHNFSNGDSAGVQLKTVSGSFATINVFTGVGRGDAVAAVSGDNVFLTATGRLKLRFDGGTTEISSSVDITGSLKVEQGVQITGSLILSQSGLSSGEDVFVLGAPREGGSSLEGVIRSTVDDGMHLYGNKNFKTGANTFSGGITGFESGPVQLGSAGSPVNLEMQNNSAIKATGGTLPITGSVDISGSLAIAGITNVSASIAAAENVAAFPFTGSAGISGSLDIDGQVTGGVTSLAIASTTASMDFNDGNFFNLTLANAVDTHLDATNVAAGQTISLVVTNNATGAGTLSFSPDFKFSEGTAPTVTAAVDAVDILTFVTTDATSVYGTGLLNFS